MRRLGGLPKALQRIVPLFIKVLGFQFCLLFLAVMTGSVCVIRADDYPTKPIRLIVGFLPGAGSDVSARIIAQGLGSRLGQPVLVVNRPGAGSMIGVSDVVRSAADGYTLLHVNSDGLTILSALRRALPYDVHKDFSFITLIAQIPLVVVVSSNLPVHSMAELISYAKAHPGELHYGSSGVGTAPHLAALLFSKSAGITMSHVPYRGAGGSMSDLFAGRIDLVFLAAPTIAAQASSDKVRLIAVTGAKRSPLFPEVPTMEEVGLPQATMVVWYGLLGPAGLPEDVLERLRRDSLDALNSPEIKERFHKAGFETTPLVGEEFKKFVLGDFEKWKKVADSTNLHLDN
jgi:tripartite-type tricarboxylate transporter receptor subunit TctC